MKGSAITGPVGKEAAELWPVSFLPFPLLSLALIPSQIPLTKNKIYFLTCNSAYRIQLRCRHVMGLLSSLVSFRGCTWGKMNMGWGSAMNEEKKNLLLLLSLLLVDSVSGLGLRTRDEI